MVLGIFFFTQIQLKSRAYASQTWNLRKYGFYQQNAQVQLKMRVAFMQQFTEEFSEQFTQKCN